MASIISPPQVRRHVPPMSRSTAVGPSEKEYQEDLPPCDHPDIHPDPSPPPTYTHYTRSISSPEIPHATRSLSISYHQPHPPHLLEAIVIYLPKSLRIPSNPSLHRQLLSILSATHATTSTLRHWLRDLHPSSPALVPEIQAYPNRQKVVLLHTAAPAASANIVRKVHRHLQLAPGETCEFWDVPVLVQAEVAFARDGREHLLLAPERAAQLCRGVLRADPLRPGRTVLVGRVTGLVGAAEPEER